MMRDARDASAAGPQVHLVAPIPVACAPLSGADLAGLAARGGAGPSSATCRTCEKIACGHRRGDFHREMYLGAKEYCTICRLHEELKTIDADLERVEEGLDGAEKRLALEMSQAEKDRDGAGGKMASARAEGRRAGLAIAVDLVRDLQRTVRT